MRCFHLFENKMYIFESILMTIVFSNRKHIQFSAFNKKFHFGLISIFDDFLFKQKFLKFLKNLISLHTLSLIPPPHRKLK